VTLTLSVHLDHFGRDTNGRHIVRDISRHHGSGSDGSPPTNSTSWDYHSPNPQEGSLADLYTSTKVHAWGNVTVGSDVGVVIYRCASVDDGIVADPSPRIHDGACTRLYTSTQLDAYCQGGHWVYHVDYLFAVLQ
jgi:hypothetical protein